MLVLSRIRSGSNCCSSSTTCHIKQQQRRSKPGEQQQCAGGQESWASWLSGLSIGLTLSFISDRSTSLGVRLLPDTTARGIHSFTRSEDRREEHSRQGAECCSPGGASSPVCDEGLHDAGGLVEPGHMALVRVQACHEGLTVTGQQVERAVTERAAHVDHRHLIMTRGR